MMNYEAKRQELQDKLEALDNYSAIYDKIVECMHWNCMERIEDEHGNTQWVLSDSDDWYDENNRKRYEIWQEVLKFIEKKVG